MDVYSCRLRLKGSLLNTVNKDAVTAAEIMLLDHIHEGDNPAVYDIQKIGEAQRSDRTERQRLSMLYGEMMGRSGEQVVASVLGAGNAPLPQSLLDDEAFKERIVESNGILAALELARKASDTAKPRVEELVVDKMLPNAKQAAPEVAPPPARRTVVAAAPKV